ncbi:MULTISPECIES: phage virion morphogenesis protein [unclassified Paraburkholderia]|uniref:phage virion morphogenesis protein n=1 Tax=unclassified Paraburkholderia TaxID=2615204 RepID=UPI002AB1C9BC|nr:MULTISPECIES: phage virion morphogenesis protein [unclassified Paraburkholderia]
MMHDLRALETWATALLTQLAPPARRKVMTAVARDLRRSQQTRIASQQNPDGTAYTARKAKPAKNLRGKSGRIKHAAMFARLRTARYLTVEATPDGLALGFTGRVARIARVHQLGELAPVSPGGPNAQYPARRLLGFTDADRELIRDQLLHHIANV